MYVAIVRLIVAELEKSSPFIILFAKNLEAGAKLANSLSPSQHFLRQSGREIADFAPSKGICCRVLIKLSLHRVSSFCADLRRSSLDT